MKQHPIRWDSFTRLLSDEIAFAARQGTVLALVVVQLRSLHLYNFKWGFNGGEAIVAEMTVRLANTLKHIVAIERIAPDKIAVIVTDVAVPGLLSMSARKIIDGLAKPFALADDSVSVEASVAIAIYPDHGGSAEALVSEVFLSLHSNIHGYRAYHIPRQPHSPKHLTLLSMQQELLRALEKESLSLHYQPKISLDNFEMVGCEALMRWTLADGTKIMPDEFIPLAEATREIHRLTEWLLHTGLRENTGLGNDDGQYSVAVNVSASSIYDPSFVLAVESAVAFWGMPPEALTLEITETTLMTEPELCYSHLAKIRDLGVRIAIDDFGTGFSSLAYFKSIPADEIKIDQSFVIAMNKNEADQKIVEAIIALSHKFGLKVVAEGIENREVLTKLQQLGCDIGQGYYLARPMALDQYQDWLQAFDGKVMFG